MTNRQQFLNPVRQFNKRVLNRLTRRFANISVGPVALIYHVGRRSGKSYETPIFALLIDGGFILALTYGPNVDWYRNVLAAGYCTLRWHGKEYAIAKIEPVNTETGLARFGFPYSPILRLLGTQDFVRMMYKAS
jgi:deazaflavin-dependent oxidoreductase (nitroreductase family)